MQLQSLSLVCAVAAILSSSAMLARAQDRPASVEALTVCEAIKNLQDVEGKPLAIVGRLSVRSEGRWISEENCSGSESEGKPVLIPLAYDAKEAPRVKTGWEVSGSTMRDKLALVRRWTKLASFPFGTSDYDRWAVVYGRLRLPAGAGEAKAASGKPAAELLFAGDGYVQIVK